MRHLTSVTPIGISFLVWIGVALAAPTLAGSEWGPGGDSNQFIQFQSGGKVSGSGGCNRFFGSYSQSSNKLEFGPMGSTKMMCTQQVMAREWALFAMLAKARRFKREDHKLTLFDGAGKQIARFNQRDWD